jgi:hypothetical protein
VNILREISQQLQAERGIGGVSFVSGDGSEEHFFKGSVAEFLLDPKNQHGLWRIDGGWGGPPGPIHVRWNEQGFWENGGFCGRGFKNEQ